MTPLRVVIAGYATLDYVVQSEEDFHGTGTVLSALGISEAWPRAGGAALYASRRVAAAGHQSFALTWIGDDADGGHYLRACQRSNICCEAISQTQGATTPRCILIYGPSGDYGCLLDVGQTDCERLSEQQVKAVKAANHVCFTAGPAQASNELLDLLPEGASVSWIAKRDTQSFPHDLCKRLAGVADIIFCNASEREFIESAFVGSRKQGQLLIETLGSAGVLIDSGEGQEIIPAHAVRAQDTTGAGDTLAGEVIAGYLTGQMTIREAVQNGMTAARSLILSRTKPQT